MAQHVTTSYNDLVNLIDMTLVDNNDILQSEAVMSNIFIKHNHPNGTGDTQRFEEFDTELYADDKAQNSNASIFRSQMGYSIDAVIRRKAFNVEYSYEFKNYTKSQYDVVSKLTRAALKAQSNRLDLDLQHIISFAASTSYTNKSGNSISLTVGDGLALGSTVHTLRASSSTYRSRIANNPQYSTSAFELALQAFSENNLNHFGEKQYQKANVIWSTDNRVVMNAIRRDLHSTADVNGINSGVSNELKDEMRHVVLSKVATTAAGVPDTSKRNMWGILCAGPEGFQAYYALNENAHRDDTDEGSATYDNRKDMWSIPFRIGYSIAVLSGRYFMYSSGDGAA